MESIFWYDFINGDPLPDEDDSNDLDYEPSNPNESSDTESVDSKCSLISDNQEKYADEMQLEIEQRIEKLNIDLTPPFDKDMMAEAIYDININSLNYVLKRFYSTKLPPGIECKLSTDIDKSKILVEWINNINSPQYTVDPIVHLIQEYKSCLDIIKPYAPELINEILDEFQIDYKYNRSFIYDSSKNIKDDETILNELSTSHAWKILCNNSKSDNNS